VTSLIIISLVFGASALVLIALLFVLARRKLAARAEQVRAAKTAKRLGNRADLPPIEPVMPA
jgi:hypothetical protein